MQSILSKYWTSVQSFNTVPKYKCGISIFSLAIYRTMYLFVDALSKHQRGRATHEQNDGFIFSAWHSEEDGFILARSEDRAPSGQTDPSACSSS